MAKKPQKNTPAPVADGEAGAAPQSGRKRLIILAALGLLIAGGGGGAWFVRGKSGGGTEAPPTKPAAFLDVREMTVNLSPEPNQDRARFLKFKVALEVNDPKTIALIQPLLPRVEDTFQVFVRELRGSDLEGSAGIYRLREELLRRVNLAVSPAKVDAVLFKDIVVQ